MAPDDVATTPGSKSRNPRRSRKPVNVALTLALALYLLASVGLPWMRLTLRFGPSGFWSQTLDLARGSPLAGQAEDRINLLLLGVYQDEGSVVPKADTIILVSIKPSTGQLALLSIPRDLVVPYPDGIERRINEAYDSRLALPNRGVGALATAVVGNVVGVPIHYFAAIDLAGFRDVVDALGGVPVLADRPFTDPHLGVSYSAGWHWLNGEEALGFCRSRFGDNNEGSDFARVRRQQRVLLALVTRLQSWAIRLNPRVTNDLVGCAGASVQTNLEAWQIARLAHLSATAAVPLIRLSLDNRTEGLLVEARNPEGAYLLRPRSGDFGEIRARVEGAFAPRAADEPLRSSARREARRSHDGEPLAVVPRPQWDDHPPVTAPAPPRRVRRIVIHHDAVQYRPKLSGEEKVRTLLEASRRRENWPDLPYHYLIDRDGRIFAGLPEDEVGETHTRRDTESSLDIALLGDYSLSEPTDAQIQSLARLVRAEARQHELDEAAIRLHADLVPTQCPGTLLRKRLAGMRWLDPASGAQASDEVVSSRQARERD